jgi:hypothetical protein
MFDVDEDVHFVTFGFFASTLFLFLGLLCQGIL